MGNEYLPNTASKITVRGNRNLTRTCMYESSNNHEISLMNMWKEMRKKLKGHLPDYAIDKVKTIYADYCKNNSNRDKVKWSIVAGFAYYVSIITGINLLKFHIARAFKLDDKRFSKGLVIAQNFIAKTDPVDFKKYNDAQVKPISIIETYGKKLGYDSDTIDKACRVAKYANRSSVLSPAITEILAAATLFAAATYNHLEPNMETITETFNVSANGVRKYSNHIIDNPQLFAME